MLPSTGVRTRPPLFRLLPEPNVIGASPLGAVGCTLKGTVKSGGVPSYNGCPLPL